MSNSVVAAAVLLMGISYGWEELPEGGYVYIVQIEPHTLQALKSGEAIQSDIPPFLRGVRSYRITVGTGQVPREGKPELAEEAPASGSSPTSASDAGFPQVPGTLPLVLDGKPVPERPAVFIEPMDSAEPTDEPATEPEASSKPWGPLAMVLALLLGSVSGNFYLSWITWDARSRYRRLLHRVNDEQRELPEYLDLPEMPEQPE